MKPGIISLLSVACLAGIVSGCTSTYESTSAVRTISKLKADASTYVALPEDGRFEKIPYPGSGRKTALVVCEAFSKHLIKAELAPEVLPYEQNLQRAKSGSFDYLIVPTILHWEDRATEWSGRLDRIQIEIRTVNVPTSETLAIESIKGKSKWATFGGDVPEDLLKVPINSYVDTLFDTPPDQAHPPK